MYLKCIISVSLLCPLHLCVYACDLYLCICYSSVYQCARTKVYVKTRILRFGARPSELFFFQDSDDKMERLIQKMSEMSNIRQKISELRHLTWEKYSSMIADNLCT